MLSDENIFDITDRTIRPTDLVSVDPNGLCPWHRSPEATRPVIYMSRTGQVVCLRCLYRLLEILSKWYAENLETFSARIKSEVLKKRERRE